ncbi:MAG: hypothetical protein LBJ45_00170 [Holosporaceae bacterium]|jgi:hypothetical protein|nr:hypothetical protein [Holosporaceae bacterium]
MAQTENVNGENISFAIFFCIANNIIEKQGKIMTILRGIRSLSETYDRVVHAVTDTEENISSTIIFETEDESSSVKLANVWPDFIGLKASMSPATIASAATVERIENGYNLGKMSIYNAPKIDAQSSIAGPASCCSKITVNFENIGSYSMEGKAYNFFGKTFDEYEIKFPLGYIFEKTFLTCSNGVSLTEKYSQSAPNVVLLEHAGEQVQCRFYPYGGFFEYGVHPQRMESCVFRTTQDGKSLLLRISSLTTMKNLGLDPTEDKMSKSGHKFIGVKEFSPSQKMNLYDELKSGACRLEIINRNTNEKCFYVSSAIEHVAKTNLITINFLKESENESL